MQHFIRYCGAVMSLHVMVKLSRSFQGPGQRDDMASVEHEPITGLGVEPSARSRSRAF